MKLLFLFFRITTILAVLVPILLYVAVNVGGAFQGISTNFLMILPPEIAIPIFLIAGYAVYSFLSSFIPD